MHANQVQGKVLKGQNVLFAIEIVQDVGTRRRTCVLYGALPQLYLPCSLFPHTGLDGLHEHFDLPAQPAAP